MTKDAAKFVYKLRGQDLLVRLLLPALNAGLHD